MAPLGFTGTFIRPSLSRNVSECGSGAAAFHPAGRALSHSSLHLRTPWFQGDSSALTPQTLADSLTFSRSVLDCGSPLPLLFPTGRALRNILLGLRIERRSRATASALHASLQNLNPDLHHPPSVPESELADVGQWNGFDGVVEVEALIPR